MLDHVTGKCQYKEPAFITTNNGVYAQLFRVWMKAENSSNIMLVNTAEMGQDSDTLVGQIGQTFKGKIDSQIRMLESKLNNFCETLRYKLDNVDIIKTAGGGDREANIQKEFYNVLEMCLELRALFFTLKREDLVDEVDFQVEVI